MSDLLPSIRVHALATGDRVYFGHTPFTITSTGQAPSGYSAAFLTVYARRDGAATDTFRVLHRDHSVVIATV